MFIKTIIIEGVEKDVRIEHTFEGAQVFAGLHLIFEVAKNEPRESRFEKATKAAGFICGRDRQGRVAATNSMLHDVLDAIDRVAGC